MNSDLICRIASVFRVQVATYDEMAVGTSCLRVLCKCWSSRRSKITHGKSLSGKPQQSLCRDSLVLHDQFRQFVCGLQKSSVSRSKRTTCSDELIEVQSML